ncbi:type II secretion system minor pseudopilin GspK [Vibrio sp. RC27]
MMKGPRKQSGVALIIVLLALSLMVSLAAVIAENVFTQFQRATQREHYQQAYWYAIGVESLAKVVIKQSFEDDSDTTNLSQAWASEEQIYPLDYGTVVGRIYDRQACFNMNVFANAALTSDGSERTFLIDVFSRLLDLQELDNYEAEVIAGSLSEYLDSDDNVDVTDGVEDSYYESLTPSYLPPDGEIADTSELRAVQQMTSPALTAMKSVVCALPTTDWLLNINTLSEQQAPLLVALFSPYLSLSNAETLISSRPYDGWADVESFYTESQIASIDESTLDDAERYLDVVSNYYELDAAVTVEKSQVRIRTLFYSPDESNTWVVRRQFGGMREQHSDHPDQ